MDVVEPLCQGETETIFEALPPIAIVWVWFMVPEFKGRSLEELDEMFGERRLKYMPSCF